MIIKSFNLPAWFAPNRRKNQMMAADDHLSCTTVCLDNIRKWNCDCIIWIRCAVCDKNQNDLIRSLDIFCFNAHDLGKNSVRHIVWGWRIKDGLGLAIPSSKQVSARWRWSCPKHLSRTSMHSRKKCSASLWSCLGFPAKENKFGSCLWMRSKTFFIRSKVIFIEEMYFCSACICHVWHWWGAEKIFPNSYNLPLSATNLARSHLMSRTSGCNLPNSCLPLSATSLARSCLILMTSGWDLHNNEHCIPLSATNLARSCLTSMTSG